MKSKLNLTILLFLLSAMMFSATGADNTKQIRKGWTKNGITALKINNRFGEVKINDAGGDSVTIKVIITVEDASESRAKDLMDKINIDIQKSGGLVSAETQIEDNFKSKQSFSIDYLVNIPKDRNLDISNKYGNVSVEALEASGNFDISYGNMNAGKMKAPAGNPIKLSIKYGKADLETINVAQMEFSYSKLYAGEIGNLLLDSKYSTVNLQKTSELTLNSKYDAINVDEIGSLKAESKYTNYKIELLTGSFDLNTGYGSVRIGKVDPKFDKINIVNSYGGINIGLDNLNYKLNADCDYCEIKYPEDRFKGNKISENHRLRLDGNVGNGGKTVSITSRYGGVKLEE